MKRDPILITLVAGLSAFAAAFGMIACGGQTSQSGTVSYASCAEAEAAGAAPLSKGDPGYTVKLDRDGDGTACDQTAAKKMTFAECEKSAEYDGGRYAVEFDNGICKVQRP